MPWQPRRDSMAATTWCAHGSDHSGVDNAAHRHRLDVVPPAVRQPLTKQLQRRLCPVLLRAREVQVIEERNKLVADRRAVLVAAALFTALLDVRLQLHGSRARREREGDWHHLRACRLRQVPQHVDGFARACGSNQHHVHVALQQLRHEGADQHRLWRRHHDLAEVQARIVRRRGRTQRRPGHPLAGVRLEAVVVHQPVGGDGERVVVVLHLVAQERRERGAVVLTDDRASRPHQRKDEHAFAQPRDAIGSALCLRGVAGGEGLQRTVQQPRHGRHDLAGVRGHRAAAPVPKERQRRRQVAVEALAEGGQAQRRQALVLLQPVAPRRQHGVGAHQLWLVEHHATPRHRRR